LLQAYPAEALALPSCCFQKECLCAAYACRLPKLDSISLTIDPATPRQPQRNKPGVVSLLRAMRKHLSGMHNLSLTSEQNWQGAGKVWSELAQATQLTSLTLVFTDEVSTAAGTWLGSQ
jgi:hypothetical protein